MKNSRVSTPMAIHDLISLFVVASALAVGSACGPAAGPASDWAPIGETVDAGEPGLMSFRVSTAIDPTVDRPVVALHELGSGGGVVAKAWSGEAWEVLGPPLAPRDTGTGLDRTTSLAVDADGVVWLVWIEDDTRRAQAQHVHVARWDGAWSRVGGDLAVWPLIEDDGPNNDARLPSLALDASGRPWVAWLESEQPSASLDVQVKRWDGGSWVAVGPEALASDPEDTSVALRFDGEDRAVIVFETTAVGGVFSVVAVRRWDGAVWEPLGELSGGDRGYQRAPSAEFAPDGERLFVSYRGGPAGAYQLYVDEWDGASWGSSLVADGVNVGTSTIAVDAQGRPIVTWDQQLEGQTAILAARREADGWAVLGGEIDGDRGHNFAPVIAIDSADAPIVVWDDGSGGDRHALARRWEGGG